LLFAMGPQFPTRVSASGGTYIQKDREVPDTYSTVVEYPDFYISISGSLANAAAQKYLPQVIYGHKGSIVIEEKQVRVTPEPVYTPGGAGKVHTVEQGDLNQDHTDEFFACMRTRKKTTLHAEFGYQIMTAIRLGVDSYREGRLMVFDRDSQEVSGQAPARPGYQGDGTNHPKARKTV
jgi:predicted dehydrogenase